MLLCSEALPPSRDNTSLDVADETAVFGRQAIGLQTLFVTAESAGVPVQSSIFQRCLGIEPFCHLQIRPVCWTLLPGHPQSCLAHSLLQNQTENCTAWAHASQQHKKHADMFIGPCSQQDPRASDSGLTLQLRSDQRQAASSTDLASFDTGANLTDGAKIMQPRQNPMQRSVQIP